MTACFLFHGFPIPAYADIGVAKTPAELFLKREHREQTTYRKMP